MERLCKKCGRGGPFPKQGRLCKKCDAERKAVWYRANKPRIKPRSQVGRSAKRREQKDKEFSTSFLAFLMDAETE